MWPTRYLIVCEAVFVIFITLTPALASLTAHRALLRPLQCRGWRRKVEVAGGEVLTLTSPHFPASYDYHTACGWIFKPTSRNVALTLRCDAFRLQDARRGRCDDFLRVENIKYCGSNVPVISTTNTTGFRVVFLTDGKNNYQGFKCTLAATNSNTQDCTCGVQGSDGEDLWQAGLVLANSSEPFCSASIVRERWLLTSATCAARIKHNKHDHAAVVGASREAGGTRLPIKRIFLHPAFKQGKARSEANLALVHLKEAVTFEGGRARPVCLPLSPARHRPASGTAGWRGWRGAAVHEEECVAAKYSNDAWLCGRPADLCRSDRGDLGGPLVAEGEGGEGWVQVGVAAGGSGCLEDQDQDSGKDRGLSDPDPPAVYTSVINYLPWIIRTMGRDNTCPDHL